MKTCQCGKEVSDRRDVCDDCKRLKKLAYDKEYRQKHTEIHKQNGKEYYAQMKTLKARLREEKMKKLREMFKGVTL
jgi:glutaredoxin